MSVGLAVFLFLTPPPTSAPASAPPAPAAAPRDAATHSAIEAVAQVPAEMESCLDHAVVELGLGAKKNGRTWRARGELVHATIAAELNVFLRLEPAGTGLGFLLHTDWPGAEKDAALQAELEARHVAAVTRAARICGIVHPEVTCRRIPAGAAPVPCQPRAG